MSILGNLPKFLRLKNRSEDIIKRVEKVWRVFWHRVDQKWHRYPPCPEVRSVEEFLSVVDLDENYCF
ncbi:MAG: DUF3024 domain-containing protein [Desulfobacteraceae bacterium]|nr:MAG: DUF3024 domain-containing protein [Desulfobacteraceae bacterium]